MLSNLFSSFSDSVMTSFSVPTTYLDEGLQIPLHRMLVILRTIVVHSPCRRNISAFPCTIVKKTYVIAVEDLWWTFPVIWLRWVTVILFHSLASSLPLPILQLCCTLGRVPFAGSISKAWTDFIHGVLPTEPSCCICVAKSEHVGHICGRRSLKDQIAGCFSSEVPFGLESVGWNYVHAKYVFERWIGNHLLSTCQIRWFWKCTEVESRFLTRIVQNIWGTTSYPWSSFLEDHYILDRLWHHAFFSAYSGEEYGFASAMFLSLASAALFSMKLQTTFLQLRVVDYVGVVRS